jgi:hypothetical protein
MGVAQRNAAELYLAATAGAGSRPEDTTLLMNTFPAQGMNTTYEWLPRCSWPTPQATWRC